MELNRENIIKALECCIDGDCYPCPYAEVGAGCRDKMCEATLALIKELTEENKARKASNIMLNTEIRRLGSENEAWQQRMIAEKEQADKAYYDLACEVEDLRAENERLRDTAYRLECEVHRERANTVRKMQDEVNRSPDILDVNGYRMIGVDIVDLIAKRMVEDLNRDTE